MLTQYSNEFKKYFLLRFTYQLIKVKSVGELYELKKLLEKELEKDKTKVKKRVQHVIKEKEEIPFRSLQQKVGTSPQVSQRKPVLRIPETRLPQHLNYLKPRASNVEINLGKLNPLVKDSNVREMQCPGPDENILVKGSMGTKPTGITLSKQEVDEIINTFSEKAKIPVNQGNFKVAVGQLLLNAVVSEQGSKFIIRKLPKNARQNNQ